MTGIPILFAGSGVERLAELRGEAAALAAAFADPGARFLPVWQSRCLLLEGAPAVCRREEIAGIAVGPDDVVFLGRRDGQFLFAVEFRGATPPPGFVPDDFLGLRDIVSRVDEADAALLAYARAMIIWQERHRHCGVCGAPNRSVDGGFVMACTREACGQRSFPRLDPAIIVLVHQGHRCLLGRQTRWPEGRFSTIAGFVEPGESLEDAVAREVKEETNIEVGRAVYLASQPWPFPAALMIGFHAEAVTEDIRYNDGELAEARWLTRGDIAARQVTLPPTASIAYRLIEAWFDAEPGPRLASLNLDSAMFRRPGQPPEYN